MRSLLLLFAGVVGPVSGCGRVAFDARSDARIDAVAFDGAAPDALVCPIGYTFEAVTGSCYRTEAAVAATWLDAEAACEADGAHLAVIDNNEEAAVLDRYLPASDDFAWIGMTDQVTEGTYVTVLNQPSTYLKWGPNEPDGDVTDCVVLVANQDLSDSTCGTLDEYICEYDRRRAASPAWGVCPAGYMFAGTGCYRVAPTGNTSWLDAEIACEADGPGAHLVVLDSTGEANTVSALATLDYWVGASDIVNEAVFPSVTNGAFGFIGFATGEPDGGTAENCLRVAAGPLLYSEACGAGDDYVCEYDAIDAVPAAYGQ